MATETPKTPAPRIVRTKEGVDRFVPAPEYLNIHPKDLARYQSDALEVLDELRQKVLNGQVIGIGYAVVGVEDGDPVVARGWSSGFAGYGIHASGAIAYLSTTFNQMFYMDD